MNDFFPQWRNASDATSEATRDDAAAEPWRAWNDQRAALAEGLMRLNREGRALDAALPQPSLPSGLDALAPGQALTRILQSYSSQKAVWGRDRLVATSRQLREQGMRPTEDAFFYTDLRAMNVISHAIEERIIAERLDCEVYAGFQRLSLLRPQFNRYRALLDSARYVYAYGLDDMAGQAPDPRLAQLQPPRFLRFTIAQQLQTGMEWFWFVVVDDPRLRTALLAQHTEGDLWAHEQNARRYTGLWTFDAQTVADIVTVLRRAARTLFYAQ